jgi:2-oxoglutarate/2-oxoacid ferredoxin oxidoreductase subunit alpha
MPGEVTPAGTLVHADKPQEPKNERLPHAAQALAEATLESVVIRFAGDSGDGMQLTGSQFATTSALIGNDIATLPDFPAEIRAPAGTLPGVSSFQLQFASGEIFTPGDEPDVLVAMNAAALKVHLPAMRPGQTVIANTDGFDSQNLTKSGYSGNPIEDGSLDAFRLIAIPLSTLTLKVLESSTLGKREKLKCKNFYALGVLYWVYSRPLEATETWIQSKFKKLPEVAHANLTALRGGYAYAAASELFEARYEVPAAPQEPGLYRSISGNKAIALGLYAASVKGGLPLFLGSYPITPASDILAELAALKPQGVITMQAEDEIAAVCAAIGSAFAGGIGVTSTSGPGVALKNEAVGLAVMTELPLVVVNVQRGGPSTGLPTKTEQSDLLQAMCGRNGECPVVVLAPQSASDCFDIGYEAVRLAVIHMTPVFVLSDGYIANGSEPWLVPAENELRAIPVQFRQDPAGFQPFLRDQQTLARAWAIPGTPGLEHRIGGLEHANGSGNISYDPDVHEEMVQLRAEKVARVADDIPLAEAWGDQTGDLLVVGWGGTFGALRTAVKAARAKGLKVSHLHLRHLNPFPRNLKDVLDRFDRVLVAELNLGQLDMLLRARFLRNTYRCNKVQGQPFRTSEIVSAIESAMEGERR